MRTPPVRAPCWLAAAWALSSFLLALLSRPLLAATPPPSTFHIPRLAGEVVVDGRLDEPVWEDALAFDLSYETRPGENIAPPVETHCRMLYTVSHLYFGCHAWDPEPRKIRARLTDRDQSSFSDDTLGLAIDPFNTRDRSFVLEVNPLGVQNDRMYSDSSRRSDSSWDAIWESAGRIVEDGWIVEVSIPFSSLRFPRAEGKQTWSFNFRRSMPREVSRRIELVPDDRGNPCRSCQQALLIGFEDLDPGRHLEVTPTLVGIQRGALAVANDSASGVVRESADFDPGLTVRWGVTPNLALSGTLNPDFSQVEADVARLDINEQFALFFPERRPFFLEGQEYFATPLNVVHTRSVADPDLGLKITGREGKHSMGAFVVRDTRAEILLPGPEGSSIDLLERDTDIGVFRYQRDLGPESSLGMVYTDRRAGEYENRVGGIDTRLRLSRADVLTVQVLGSSTDYSRGLVDDNLLPESRVDGSAILARYRHSERSWSARANYRDIDDGFRADLGFLPKVGVERYDIGGDYRIYGDADHWFTGFNFGARASREDRQNGNLLSEEIEAYANYNGPKQSHLGGGLGDSDRVFEGQTFSTDSWWTEGFIRPARSVGLGIGAWGGDAIDFEGRRPGESLTVNPRLDLRLGRHLHARLAHTYRELDLAAGNLFEAQLSELRVLYQINVRTFVRAIVQRTDIVRNPTLYEEAVDPRREDLFGQLLFSYKLNPQSALFLGYTGDWLSLETLNGRKNSGFTETANSLFMKISYAWVP